jgi:hypothetical protein
VIADLGLVGGVGEFITIWVDWVEKIVGRPDLRSNAVEAIGDCTDRDGGEEELLTGEEYRGGGEIRMVGRKNRR